MEQSTTTHPRNPPHSLQRNHILVAPDTLQSKLIFKRKKNVKSLHHQGTNQCYPAQTIKSLDLLLAHCVNHAYHYPTTTQSQGLEQIQSSRRITQPKKQARIGRDLLTAHKYFCAEAPHAQNLRGQTHQPPSSHHHRGRSSTAVPKP